MKKLLATLLVIALAVPAFAYFYNVRIYCEDETAFKFTTQPVGALDPTWKPGGCGAHSVRDFSVVGCSKGSVTADEGYVMLPTVVMVAPSKTKDILPVANPNDVCAIQVELPRIDASDIQVYVDGAQADKSFGCGLYSSDGNTKLWETGAVSMSSTGKKKVTLGTTKAITPGVYWYAWTSDTTSGKIRGLENGVPITQLFDDTIDQLGKAANAGTAGVLPATLGTITYADTNVPIVLVKP